MGQCFTSGLGPYVYTLYINSLALLSVHSSIRVWTKGHKNSTSLMIVRTIIYEDFFFYFLFQGPLVHSVRFVRLTRECWTSIVSWDALKWPKWRAFPKTSSLWDAAYEEPSSNNNRQRGRWQFNMAQTCLLPSWEQLPWWFYTTSPSGLAPGNLFLGFVYRSTADAHTGSLRCP